MSRLTNYCKICKKTILASVWKIHVMGKKHVHYTPNKITISGAFSSEQIEKVDDYFKRFGTYGDRKVTIDGDKVSIDYSFKDRRTHSFIIYKEHTLFGKRLEITWEEITTPLPFPPHQNNKNSNAYNRNNRSNKEERGEAVDRKGSKKKAANSESCKHSILKSVRDGQSFNEQVTILQNKLQENKNEMEKNKQVIYDDLSAALAPTFASSQICFFGSSITGLDVQGSDLDVYIANVREQYKPEVATLKVIRQLIFKCRKFCDVLLISGAKIPIIKCIHTKTQLCCDLNIRNKLSVCNSQLINYYLSLNDKLRPLVIMIKFWADCNGLKKVNFFSSYALYMMTIFYLQQVYNLPSIKDLQEESTPDVVDGWNCAFNRKELSNSVLQNETILDLVGGFFKFYSDFDYVSNLISPYLGTVIKKARFLKPFDLPDCYQEYKNQKQLIVVNSGICVQDPFEHCRNVAASVPLQCAGKFTAICRNALTLIEKGEKELLYKILADKNVSEYIFEITKPDEKDKEEWTESVKNLTFKILEDVLNLKIIETKMKNQIIYTCLGDYNVWENRTNIFKTLMAQLPPDLNELDKEIAVTKCIIKYFPQSSVTNLSINATFKKDSVQYEMKQLNKKSKNFLHASHFFRVRLTQFLAIPGMEISESRVPTPAPPEVEETPSGRVPVLSRKPHSTKMIQRDRINDKNDANSGDSPGRQAVTPKETNEHSVKIDENGDDEAPKDNLEEDEEEDVPADFFDDFSNQDFMDGLDIVDAWDEECKLSDPQFQNLSESSQDKSDKKPHSPIRFVSSKSPEKRQRKYPRSRSKSPLRRYINRSNSFTRKRSRSRSRDKNRAIERRDPEKTRRDIHKDKIKCARDKEQKIVSDKLRIVETGLVPPGTEMDVDLNTIMKEKRRSNTGSSAERVRERELKPEREVRQRELIKPEMRERELLKPDRDRRYLKRSGSRERKPFRYSPSPNYRSRPREPVHRPRKRTSSVGSNVSDRELWIRSRKRTRSRSRSRDPLRRAKTKKYDEVKKKSFLEEIRDKLNETRTPLPSTAASSIVYNVPTYNNAPHLTAAPVPVPAPGPQYFPQAPQSQSIQQYDQSFFIGDTYRMNQPQNVMAQPQNIGFHMISNPGNVVSVPRVQMSQVQHIDATSVQTPPAPLIKEALPKLPNFSDLLKAKLVEEPKQKDRGNAEDVDRLFADKKISLSDFLTITAKCEVQSASPEHLQKKIKVISRCQDAIKAMSDDRKFTGRLSVRKSSEPKNKNEVKYQSPLRRIPVVRFQFTTPAKAPEESDVFGAALDKILQKIGILREIVDWNESTESVAKLPNSSFADEETSVLSLKASILGIKKFEVKSECEECKKRKQKTFSEVGSQCVDNKETVSVATQVIEEDLNPKGLLKNDSIAYLTPAQLLIKDKEKEAEKTAAQTQEKIVEKNDPLSTPEIKKDRPKPPNFKSRGGFRKPIRERQFNNFEPENYDYGYFDRVRPMFEETRENFGQSRYGGGPPAQFPRQFIEEETRLLQFREEESSFLDFAEPYRGRGGRFSGPRY